MSTPTRQIVVDDTDSRIVYSGTNWTLDTGSLDNVGSYGPTYNRTSHGTNVDSGLSFNFNGTSVSVFGTIQPAKSAFWECFVDQVSIENGPLSPNPQNNWNLCEGSDLTAGPHTLSIHIAASTNTFWFDYLRYTPFSDASFSEAVLYVPSSDPGLNPSSDWEPRGGFESVDGALLALQPGATVSFDFVGTQVAWYGWLLRDEPLGPTNGTFAIDNHNPHIFTFGKFAQIGNFTNPNAMFFNTSQLTAAQHNFAVTYQGQITPLSLNYLLVTITSTPYAPSAPPSSTTSSSRSLPSTSSFSQSSSSTPISSPPIASGAHTPPVGAIVGGILGGLSLLVIVLGLYFWRSRRKHIREQADLREAQPFTLSQPLAFASGTTKGGGEKNGSSSSASSSEPNVTRVQSFHKLPPYRYREQAGPQPSTYSQPPNVSRIQSFHKPPLHNHEQAEPQPSTFSQPPNVSRIQFIHKPPLHNREQAEPQPSTFSQPPNVSRIQSIHKPPLHNREQAEPQPSTFSQPPNVSRIQSIHKPPLYNREQAETQPFTFSQPLSGITKGNGEKNGSSSNVSSPEPTVTRIQSYHKPPL